MFVRVVALCYQHHTQRILSNPLTSDYVCRSCGTLCVVLITECHNSYKHSQRLMDLKVSRFWYIKTTIELKCYKLTTIPRLICYVYKAWKYSVWSRWSNDVYIIQLGELPVTPIYHHQHLLPETQADDFYLGYKYI